MTLEYESSIYWVLGWKRSEELQCRSDKAQSAKQHGGEFEFTFCVSSIYSSMLFNIDCMVPAIWVCFFGKISITRNTEQLEQGYLNLSNPGLLLDLL
jgi:hypothetical protein